MDIKNNQWDLADEDLDLWLNRDKHESSLPLSDILKSAYLFFRQKQIEKFDQFCNQAFDCYQELERLKLNLVHETVSEYSQIMFKRSDLTKSEKRTRILKENQKIINGILSGNQKVFNDLYENEFPSVVKLIINNSGSVDIAKDVFQDALVILMEKVYTNKLDLTCTVSTYLYSVCRYLWMDQLRHKKREVPLNDSYDYIKVDISIAGFNNSPDNYANVNTAIEALGEPCKQLLESYYYKNMSWTEIASSLGYTSAASARNQKYKCLERIRSKVEYVIE